MTQELFESSEYTHEHTRSKVTEWEYTHVHTQQGYWMG